MTDIEYCLRQLGVIERGDTTTAAGLQANIMINLKEVPERDPELAEEIAGRMATRLTVYEPELLIPVPKGANKWAELTAEHMGVESVELDWLNKELGQLRFLGVTGIDKARKAGRIAIIEDVYTTGGSIKKVAAHRDIAGKVIAAGIIWNRSRRKPQLDFEAKSLIDSYIPLIEND
jgi:orotate phosphoribosyltransferase